MKRMPRVSQGKSWLKLLALLIAIFIALPGVFSACAEPAEMTLAVGCLAAISDSDTSGPDTGTPDFCDDGPWLNLVVYVYSDTDGSNIPNKQGKLSNPYAEKVLPPPKYSYSPFYEWFYADDTPQLLLPCWDYCDEDTISGNTWCLEQGQTWDILVQVWAEGYAGQAETLSLDNTSRQIRMTFFLNPL